jgi:hypothetical protein
MGLSNGASKARNYSSTVNQNQGGGNKKAGFAFQVGRSSWTSVAFASHGVNTPLKNLQMTMNPNVKQSRPVGTTTGISYWGII